MRRKKKRNLDFGKKLGYFSDVLVKINQRKINYKKHKKKMKVQRKIKKNE